MIENLKINRTVLATCVILLALFFTVNVQLFAIDPDKNYILTPDSVGIKYETFNVQTPDGYSIYSWIYFPKMENDNNKVIVLAYPDKGNMSYWVYFAAVYVQRGFTVVTFDYRGFGKSSDFKINRDFLYYAGFSTDLISVVKQVDLRFPQKKIGVWALSMGTIILTRSLKDLKNNIDFVIGDGYVTDLPMVVQRIAEFKNDTVKLPDRYSRYKTNLSKSKLPFLIFAASNDKITTSEDSKSLKLIRKNGITNLTVYEGEHLRGFQAGTGAFGEFYMNEIEIFLKSIRL